MPGNVTPAAATPMPASTVPASSEPGTPRAIVPAATRPTSVQTAFDTLPEGVLQALVRARDETVDGHCDPTGDLGHCSVSAVVPALRSAPLTSRSDPRARSRHQARLTARSSNRASIALVPSPPVATTSPTVPPPSGLRTGARPPTESGATSPAGGRERSCARHAAGTGTRGATAARGLADPASRRSGGRAACRAPPTGRSRRTDRTG
jgi:hypothetical protein